MTPVTAWLCKSQKRALMKGRNGPKCDALLLHGWLCYHLALEHLCGNDGEGEIEDVQSISMATEVMSWSTILVAGELS